MRERSRLESAGPGRMDFKTRAGAQYDPGNDIG